MASAAPKPRPINVPFYDGDQNLIVPVKLPGRDGKVDPDSEIGKGGEGWVYAVQGQDDLVVKIWHYGREPEDAEQKIRYMVAKRVEPDPSATWRVIWPEQPVKHEGVTVGYTMRRLNPGEWTQPVHYYNLSVAGNTEKEQGRELRTDNRQRMAHRLALAFKAIHDTGYVIGDVNPKNFEINRTDEIAILDCDSYGFTIPGGKTFTNNLGMAEYQAPEQQGKQTNRTQEDDCFGLAVLIFQLLNNGSHPYNSTDPEYSTLAERIANWRFPRSESNNATTTPEQNEAWNKLSDELRQMFLRCFDREHSEQLGRPTAAEWAEVLSPHPTAARTVAPRRSVPWNRRWLITLAILIPLLVAGIWMVIGGIGSGGTEAAQPLPAAAPVAVPTPTAVPTPPPTWTPVPTYTPAPTPSPVVIVVTAPAPSPVPTETPAPTAVPQPLPTPVPTNTPTPSPPTATPSPTATPLPASTRTPNQWLIQNPSHPKITNSKPETQVLMQGCYLGNQTAARRFRLASWDVWDPSKYGNELKFVKIITNTGARLPLQHGACYEATVVKHVNSTEEYVCLDRDSTYSHQSDCDSYRENEVIPTFILYPDSAEDPDDYSENFEMIRPPPHPSE